jgi:hypothetical protein
MDQQRAGTGNQADHTADLSQLDHDETPIPGHNFHAASRGLDGEGNGCTVFDFRAGVVPEPSIIFLARPVKETNIWDLRGTERPIRPLGDLTRLQAEFR